MRILLLTMLFLFSQGRRDDPNDVDDPRMKQELSGNVSVPKSGKVSIPFFPPFLYAPACMITSGEVVKNTPQRIELKNVKRKTIHYECRGIKLESSNPKEGSQ